MRDTTRAGRLSAIVKDPIGVNAGYEFENAVAIKQRLAIASRLKKGLLKLSVSISLILIGVFLCYLVTHRDE